MRTTVLTSIWTPESYDHCGLPASWECAIIGRVMIEMARLQGTRSVKRVWSTGLVCDWKDISVEFATDASLV